MPRAPPPLSKVAAATYRAIHLNVDFLEISKHSRVHLIWDTYLLIMAYCEHKYDGILILRTHFDELGT